MCGAIRFSGLEADGAPGLAAEGHRRALTGLFPAIRSIAAGLAAHYVPGTPLYGLMNASFKLIDLLPGAVLDWIGGRAGAGDDGGERTGGTAVAGISRMGAVRIGARARRGGAGS